jgi:small-conductance mechanosensitive channel
MNEIFNKELISFGDASIHVSDIVLLALVLVSTRMLLWIVKRVIGQRIKTRKLDAGRSMAVFQIFKYFVVVAAIVIGLDIIGVKVTLLLAGSAALLVGIGLGVQQLFNDLVSGIVLLVEGTVTVDDIVELDGMVGKIEEINLRTSQLLTRDAISILVPNSKLVSDNVINWSHNRKLTRFKVGVGVAYGSDVPLVRQLIKEATISHPDVAGDPEPVVRMIDFGDSSLDFEVYFWSQKMWQIEDVRSEIRIAVDRLFRENQVTIPFPQRDLHFKTTFQNQVLSSV